MSKGHHSGGRKGQQALQSSYFNRGALNANYLISASQDGSIRGGGGNPATNNLIKSYDPSSQMHQQRASANLSIGGSGIGTNFTTGGRGDSGANNSSLGVTRESSLNRARGGPNNSGQNPNNSLHAQIALRQKNSSQTGMHH